MSYIRSYNCVTPLGVTVQDHIDALLQGQTGIQYFSHFGHIPDVYLGKVSPEQVETCFSFVSPNMELTWLEKMLLLAVVPLLPMMQIGERTALVLSTTKGNISCLQAGDSLPYLTLIAKKIAKFLGITTEPIVVSNACVSGVVALSVADRLLQSDIYDSALVLAGDEISEFVLSGFQSFQAMSSHPCRPYDKARDGITLGEAAAAVFLTQDDFWAQAEILGSSSINDANHISAPSRTGEGLYLSITKALEEAGLTTTQIDFINAHGTGTLYNDEMEAIAFSRAGLQEVPLNSYKGYFGHTLGASGLLETVMSLALAQEGKLLRCEGFDTLGVSQPLNIITHTQEATIKHLLKTASGFGGSNAAMVLRLMD